ncbi:MAG: phosphatidylcholine/phosphatidylserine synthase [Planctomycetaceae bacterium]
MSPDPDRDLIDAPDAPRPLNQREARRERHRRRLRHGRQRAFAVLPTMLTLGNAACGFGSITFAAKLGPAIDLGDSGTHLYVSALLIFLAMVFDALDGRAARWANQSSEFGAQLDSLCDAISFGAAPAFLMLQFIDHFETAFEPPFEYHPRLLWVIGVLFVVCAILRLARFNVETDEDDGHDHFSGLPSPAAAGTVASFPLAIGDLVDLAAKTGAKTQPLAAFLVPTVQIALPLITLAAAVLMVSRIRYVHMFNQLFSGRRSRRHLIQVVFGIATVFLLREMAVPVLFCYFAFASPLRAAWDKRHRLGKREPAGHTE